MGIRYTGHAERRLTERGITRFEVEAVIADPEIAMPSRRGRVDVMKRIGGRLIRVLYEPHRGGPVVVTAYAPEEDS